ncbi:nucleotidyltransferase [Streptomyces sp. BBFR51]|uniref:nucleotide-binding domain-containing protein n=1 Tax=Streptomyces sp. BBFR51 TaxID=3372856 RepID=UPI0037DC082B
METSELFSSLLQNLKVGDSNITVASRRDEITKALNKEFRAKEGSTEHRLMVGSYGRHTAIRGVSDLDMLYALPPSIRANHAGETGPRRILAQVKDTLQKRYPNTEVRVDQCVVRVQFSSNSFKFEVQPVFENDDKSFSYPDSVDRGWKVTKPRDEIRATQECNERTSNNMRHLARMVRAWKNTHGVNMGGLLIDTLVHRFFSRTECYNSAGLHTYDLMVRDFFEFLAVQPDQSYYSALGSGQNVAAKKGFQPKAKKAYKRSLEAIASEGTATANKKWRSMFGTSVPLKAVSAAHAFDNSEQFIEDWYPVDIRHSLTIDCEVAQNGWRPASLRKMLEERTFLHANKTLDFTIIECSADRPFEVWWKVLNRGSEAEKRNEIRGQIIKSNRQDARHERTKFRGEHVVECYIIKDGVAVARDRIDVPIA